jgi:hypothetical protein
VLEKCLIENNDDSNDNDSNDDDGDNGNNDLIFENSLSEKEREDKNYYNVDKIDGYEIKKVKEIGDCSKNEKKNSNENGWNIKDEEIYIEEESNDKVNNENSENNYNEDGNDSSNNNYKKENENKSDSEDSDDNKRNQSLEVKKKYQKNLSIKKMQWRIEVAEIFDERLNELLENWEYAVL